MGSIGLAARPFICDHLRHLRMNSLSEMTQMIME